MSQPGKREPRNGGCLFYLFWIGLLLVGYLFVEPSSAPVNSYLVLPKEHTYLEVEATSSGEGFLDPDRYKYFDIYYVQLGGWFESSKRILVKRIDTQSKLVDLKHVHFERTSTDYFAPISVYVLTPWEQTSNNSADVVEYSWLFNPPVNFPITE